MGTAEGGRRSLTELPGAEGCRARSARGGPPGRDRRGGPNVRVLGPPGVGEGVTTRVAPGGRGTGREELGGRVTEVLDTSFFCLAGGGTSCASTRALLADFSTTALQISYDRCRFTLPMGGRFLLARAVGWETCGGGGEQRLRD